MPMFILYLADMALRPLLKACHKQRLVLGKVINLLLEDRR